MRRRYWLPGLILLVITAALIFYLRPADQTAPGKASQPLVVLVTVDALGRDLLGCYGADPSLTPQLDAFAAEATIFVDAVTPAPLSAGGTASILTGRLPIQHRLRTDTFGDLPSTEITLAEYLREGGFLTGAFLSSRLPFIADLTQGFDTLSVPQADEIAPGSVFDDAVTWLAAHRQERCFTWIHVAAPRGPWRAPHPWALRWLDDPYRGELAAFDEAWGTFIAGLRAQALLTDIHLILIAPTGEARGEEGEWEHGMLLGEATLQVPWLWRLPGPGNSQQISGLAATTDLLPTLLSALQVPVLPESPPLEGRDYSDLLTTGGITDRSQLLLETILPRTYGWAPLMGLRQAEWKLVGSRPPRLYQVQQDRLTPWGPSLERDQRIAALQELIGREIAAWSPDASDAERWLSWGEGQPDPYQQISVSSAIVKACRALQMGDPVTADDAASIVTQRFPDHPAIITLSAWILAQRGQLTEAEAAYRKALSKISNAVEARLGLAECLLEQGDPDQAATALGELRPESLSRPTWLLIKDPDFDYRLCFAQGLIHARSKKLDLAVEFFNQAATMATRTAKRSDAVEFSQAARFLSDVQRRDNYPHTYERPLIARMALLLGVPQLGRKLLGFDSQTPPALPGQPAAKIDPLDKLLMARDALIHQQIGQAKRLIEDAVDEKVARPEDCVVLAQALEHQGRLDDAIELLTFCLSAFPTSSELHFQLARMKLGKRRMESEALSHLRAALNLGFNDWERLANSAVRRLCRDERIRRSWVDPS